MSSKEDAVTQVQSELRRLTTEIDSLDERAARQFKLNRTDVRCLDVVTVQAPVTPSTLARELRMTSGGLSIMLERLERAGYIRRRPNAADRRSVLVEATPRALRLDAQMFRSLGERMRELIGRYDAEQLETLADFLRQTRLVIAEHGLVAAADEGCAAGDPHTSRRPGPSVRNEDRRGRAAR